MNEKIVNLLIELDWYQNALNFISKVYNIDKATSDINLKGSKPDINEKTMLEYVKRAEDLLNGSTNNEVKEDNK